jgi:outer membrane protein assembly factor BamA
MKYRINIELQDDVKLHFYIKLNSILWAFILMSSFMTVCTAQDKILLIQFSDLDQRSGQTINRAFKVQDSLTAIIKCREVVKSYISEGFLTCVLDSLFCSGDSCVANIYIGKKYSSGNILIDQEQSNILSSGGIRKNIFANKMLLKDEISGSLVRIAQFFADNGYPFAQIRLDSFSFDEGKLNAALITDKGPLILFDTFRISGNIEISKHFLRQYLQIRPGEPYSHVKVIQAARRMSELNFIKQENAPTVSFINNRAYLNLSTNRKSANRFDFILGVLRQPNNGSSSGNFVISGDILAELNNRFGHGEFVMAQFKRLRPENQEVILRSDFPYLPGLPVGAHLDFRLFKFGTENLDVLLTTGGQYLYSGANQLKISWHYRSSRLIEVNTAAVTQSGRLPSRLDVVYSGIGFGLTSRHVDYRFNPRKGLLFQAGINGGTRKILPNVAITSLEGFEKIYDTLDLKSILIDATTSIEYFTPIGERFTVKTAVNAGIRHNDAGVLENEKFRLGGNRLLRGFDEESIFSDRFVLLTAEMRLLFDQNSFLSLPFIDAGITRVRTESGMVNDRVLGIGIGLNFGTAAGVFNISFAAGSRLGNPLDFGQLKIHFGYISLF